MIRETATPGFDAPGPWHMGITKRIDPMLSRLRGALVALALSVALASPAAAAGEAPEEVVAGFHEVLLEVWQEADTLTPQERYDRLEPALTEAFDLPRMIRVASGPAWETASEEERQALEQAFRRYSVSTYASRFSEYTGQSLDITEEREGPRDFVLIEAEINKEGGDTVPITYVLSREDGDWQIVDIIFKGVSEMAVRRSDYRSILQEGGPQQLASRLNEQSETLLQP